MEIPVVTIYKAIVWNAYCDSRTTLRARSEEELDAAIADGQARHLYGSVILYDTERRPDPDAVAAREAELERIRLTSCPLPPESDLLLLAAAKRTDMTDYDAIHAINPSAGKWQATRARLKEIRNDKYNAYLEHTHHMK